MVSNIRTTKIGRWTAPFTSSLLLYKFQLFNESKNDAAAAAPQFQVFNFLWSFFFFFQSFVPLLFVWTCYTFDWRATKRKKMKTIHTPIWVYVCCIFSGPLHCSTNFLLPIFATYAVRSGRNPTWDQVYL